MEDQKEEYKIVDRDSQYNDQLDRRVVHGDQFGTVKYVGVLQHEDSKQKDKSELWVGIEWDSQQKGKHNGTVKGVQYFETSSKQMNGSLVRHSVLDYGRDVLDVIINRYFKDFPIEFKQQLKNRDKDMITQFNQYSKIALEGLKQKDDSEQDKAQVELDEECYVNTLKNNKKAVEFYGFNKIWSKFGDLKNIKEISLYDNRISDLGGQGQLANIFGNLRTLSIDKNLLISWDQIYFLGNELRLLEELQISSNYLKIEQDVEDQKSIRLYNQEQQSIEVDPKECFQNLKTLIATNMNLNWQKLKQVIPAFRNIDTLILISNQMRDSEYLQQIKLEYIQNLKYINLEKNQISSFEGLSKLGQIEGLERLVLNTNELVELGKIEGFNNVQYISLEYNLFKDCKVLTELSQIPNIKQLRISNNPICDQYGKTYIRQRAVAENRNINVINGGDLLKYDRKDCEIYYLRKTFDDYFQKSGQQYYDYDFNKFIEFARQNYGRIEEFIEKYGNPFEQQKHEQSEQKEEENPNKHMKILTISVMHGPLMGKTFKKQKFPETTKIQALKIFLSKKFKVPVQEQLLMYKDNENTQYVLQTLDNDNLSLFDYFNSQTAEITIMNNENQ